jgi:hypothetical protein
MGLTFTLDETLHDEGPGRWRFLVPGPGFEIVDRYEVTSTETGAHLEIRSTISYDHLPGKLAQRVMIPTGSRRSPRSSRARSPPSRNTRGRGRLAHEGTDVSAPSGIRNDYPAQPGWPAQ